MATTSLSRGASRSRHICYVAEPGGSTLIRTWQEGARPRFRVEIVCHSKGRRSVLGEYGTWREADEIASWFGRDGDLRAEVSEIEEPAAAVR